MNDDVKRLRRRQIGAAITALFLCIPLIHALSGLTLSFRPARALGDTPENVPANQDGADSGNYKPPVHLINLENKSINESSGIVASRRNTGVLWTHNDSGGKPFIFAFNRRGKHRGVWRVTGAGAVDWEDMAIGPGPGRGLSYLYIGDIGDNLKKRDQ
ncbi:MAG TPA: hypothetical protein VFY40_15570, partial [Blastocatellia bacterium]|nr:hypothetical protein [Blastocatellia bacterium]